MTRLAVIAALVMLAGPVAPADAKPARTAKSVAKPAKRAKRTAITPRTPADGKKLGAHARVTYGRDMRVASIVAPRRAEPLTPEEETAQSIQKLLRGPILRRGITGLFVADARTGEPLFAVNAKDPLNPASNVKLISTAAALELLGPEFRYPTRVLGPAPEAGVVKGDIFLLGSYDPTLTAADMHAIASMMARAGITSVEGGIVVGSDPTRDGIYRSLIPIEIAAGEPGQPPTAIAPAGLRLVDLEVTATTSKRAHRRPRLTYRTEITTSDTGAPRIKLTIGGTIGKGTSTMYPLWTKQRTANAAYSLLAALEANGIKVAHEMRVAELGDFVGDTVLRGGLPIELGRHESRPLGDIVARINKWSVNWLADRVIMTAAALSRRQQPSMELALDAMYSWLARHAQVSRDAATIDTGSGLSYQTQITSEDLVSIVRSAGGFAGENDRELSSAWLQSLAVSATDGTLRSRFRNSNAAGRVFGKTGTLSTVIALSGILDLDPARPLAFALVTNADLPLSKNLVRKAHEQVVGEICRYLTRTKGMTGPAEPSHAAEPPAIAPVPSVDTELEGNEADTALDAETASSE